MIYIYIIYIIELGSVVFGGQPGRFGCSNDALACVGFLLEALPLRKPWSVVLGNHEASREAKA